MAKGKVRLFTGSPGWPVTGIHSVIQSTFKANPFKLQRILRRDPSPEGAHHLGWE